MHPSLTEQAAGGPVTMEGFSLPAIGWCGVFYQVRSIVSWPTLRSSRRGLRLIFSDDARLGFFPGEFAAIELRQPQLNEVGRDVVSALRVTPPDNTVADILTKLQLERCRLSSIWSSGLHEPFPTEALKAYQFFRSRGPARGVHSTTIRQNWIVANEPSSVEKA
ncbi:hypothetical protein [Rhizobium sp. SYY.PMSO]|uniref:hypothetical protein n=1 Tax=Rhizobium sp. SYY.PMSO TaxID=3382192 RepID=UPI00398FC9FC